MFQGYDMVGRRAMIIRDLYRGSQNVRVSYKSKVIVIVYISDYEAVRHPQKHATNHLRPQNAHPLHQLKQSYPAYPPKSPPALRSSGSATDDAGHRRNASAYQS